MTAWKLRVGALVAGHPKVPLGHEASSNRAKRQQCDIICFAKIHHLILRPCIQQRVLDLHAVTSSHDGTRVSYYSASGPEPINCSIQEPLKYCATWGLQMAALVCECSHQIQ